MRTNSFRFLSLLVSAAALLLLSSITTFANEPGQDEFLYAQKLFDEEYYDLAAEQLERVLRDYPGFPETAEAQFLLGEAYYLTGDFEKSRTAYLRLAINFPNNPRAAEAMFKVGTALERANRSLDAAQAYTRVHGFYPTDRYAPEGLRRAVNLFLISGDTTRAETTMDQLLGKYPDSESADAARLYKAKILIRKGDREIGRRFLEWIVDRSRTDTIAAEACLELGKLLRKNYELDAAVEILKRTKEKYPTTRQAALATIELSDLYNNRGLIKESIKIAQPLLTSQDPIIVNLSRIKTGDAHYRSGNYSEALSFYEKAAKTNHEGALKSAWTLEVLNRKTEALTRYLQLSTKTSLEASHARRRAAILSGELGQWAKSTQLWSKVMTDPKLRDSSGRTNYEFIRARLKANRSIQENARNTLAKFPSSPWSDDIKYLAYTELLNSFLDKQLETIPEPASYFEDYLASEWLDSAVVLYDYFQRHLLKSPNLMERMAELSSRPLGSVSPVEWTLDWGDFYLFEFKDPVKALDQYTLVLDDSTAPTEKTLNAYRRSVQAYLFLYESALWERDAFTIEMYSDSVRSWLGHLTQLDQDSPETMTLKAEFLRLDLVRTDELADENISVLDSIRNTIRSYGAQIFPPRVIAEYVEGEIGRGRMDTLDVVQIDELTDIAASGTEDRRISARLKMSGIILNELIGQHESSIKSAKSLVSEYSGTPAAAEAVVWLMEKPQLSPTERFEWLEKYNADYPYLVIPEQHERLKADLLDSLDRPLEAITARRRALTASNWVIPELDILDAPDESAHYYRGMANMRAAHMQIAREEFRTLLNLNRKGRYSAGALLALAQLHHTMDASKTALAYLDTLNRSFPTAHENKNGMQLRPVILMDATEYNTAIVKFRELISIEDNQDSLFSYRVKVAICYYRLGHLEQARQTAKQLYKDFKVRDDLDQYKALFFLEKGHALDRIRQFDDARKQYKTIIKSYALTPWADDAAYSTGWSLIQSGEIEEGAAELNRFIENYPDSSLVQDAYLAIGLANYRIEKYSEAVSALNKVWKNENASDLWLRAFKALITVYRDARFWDAAIRVTRDYIDRFPEAADKLDKQMNIGWFYLQLGQWEDGIRYYKPLLPIADAEREAEVQFYIGEAYMSNGEYRTAILEYLKVRVIGRKTKLDWGVTALYKAGNCYEKLGEPENAARMYKNIIAERGETSNYGMTAQKRLEALELKE
ncbi:tetratricopeptide repeat protein [bacterium]|nr:tetratricopeptide repeat protein [bacterium]